MPRLANMLGATGRVEIPVPGDEPLVVVYRRSALTPRVQGRMMDVQKLAGDQVGSDEMRSLCEVFAQIISSWNLTDEDGTVIAITPDALMDVAFSTLNMVMEAIGAENRPDPLSGNGSSNGSSPTADLGPRLITTASS